MAPHNNLDFETSSTYSSLNGQAGEFARGQNGNTPSGTATGKDKDAPELIAVIGMGCRLPGGSDSPSKLWELLEAAKSGQGRFPASRFNIDGFYHPNIDRPGSLNTDGGYFIQEDVRDFENSFFGINNLEATYMDPQQRKLLEVVFECFENAGHTLEQLSGANVGCYVGNFVTDFITMQLKDSEYTHRYSATGLGTTILANRISHVFNLQGPSFVIDTACSSSLFCLHAACSALLAGECDSAVVAGANLIQSPEQQLATMKAGVLSKTSTCHSFDSSADGYGRADGIGALLVKRLSDAIRDGDPIRSVIRGTAINSNGKTNGITLPSASGQEAVVRKAYAQAGLGYEETDYVECHGTGTAVGDPIEVEGLSRVFKRSKESPLLVGSVKTNLGHSEAASGISSIIKVVLALEKGVIPPTIGVKNINPKIKVDDWNIRIVTENTPWPQNHTEKRFRRAGVNSFGYGGANAHAIFEAPEMHLPEGYTTPSKNGAIARSTLLLPLSASNPTALTHRIKALGTLNLDRVSISDLAYTLGNRRSSLATRGYILAGQTSLKEDITSDNLHRGLEGNTYSKLPLAFVFTGQGAQWPEMGRELMQEFPRFRKVIQSMDSTLQLLPHPPNWTLRGAILEPAKTSMLHHASRSQPVCTAIQVALVSLLSSWGIKPQKVIGHSSGEIAAAYTAGYVTADQAIIVAYYRGYTVTRSTKVGAMMAAGMGKEEAQEKIHDLGLTSKIRVACVNSPESVTISGDVDGIDTLKAQFDKAGVFARLLKTDGKAYHSHHMASIGQEYEDLLESALVENAPDDYPRLEHGVQFISSVTGEVCGSDIGPSYWRANLESPVLFSDVVEKIIKPDFHHLVEIGPHSALELPIKQIRTKLGISENKIHYNSALSRGKDSIVTLLTLVGDLYLHGHEVSFQAVNTIESSNLKDTTPKVQGKMILDMPKYSWNYDSQVFHEPRVSVEWRNRQYPRHDLLGSQVHGGNGILTSWRNVLKMKDIPWIEGHKLDQTVVFPGAGYIAMAVEAICQVSHASIEQKPKLKLRDIHILKALVLPEEDADTGVELFTTLQPVEQTRATESIWHRFQISSYSSGVATTHAKGLIQIDVSATPLAIALRVDSEELESKAPRTWYNKFAKGGLNFQGQFQSLTQINSHRKQKKMQILAKTELRQGGGSGIATESSYIIHPITIDSLFQAGIIASTAGNVRELSAKVPVLIETMEIHTPTGKPEYWNINAVSEPVGFGTIRVSGELYDEKNQVILQINKCRQVAYQSGTQQDIGDERHPMVRVVWKPDVALLGPDDSAEFSSYIEKYTMNASDSNVNSATIHMGAVLDLLVHKNPRLRILALSTNINEYLVEHLQLESVFKRCRSCFVGSYSEDGVLQLEDLSDKSAPTSSNKQTFDLVLLGPQRTAGGIPNIKELLEKDGALVCAGSNAEVKELMDNGFTTLQSQPQGQTQTILARLSTGSNTKNVTNNDILIVERNPDHSLNSALATQVSQETRGITKRVALEQITPELLSAHTTVITTIELEDAVLANTADDKEMEYIKILTDNCKNLVWITGGQLLKGTKPELAVAFGLSRALMLEQPSLRFFPVDVDLMTTPVEKTARQILQVVAQALEDLDPDFEFAQGNSLLHVSRFMPEKTLNRVFREKQGAEKMDLPLKAARPFHLSTGTVGQLDSIFFRKEESGQLPLLNDEVEVLVKAVGLNSKDLEAINGDSDTRDSMCTSQYTGVVTEVGSGVKSVSPGDRVVVMAPGHFASRERVPEWACEKLHTNEDFVTMSTIPLQLSTALYAIHNRAQLGRSESILICCGSDGSQADSTAIQCAQLVGADVFVIASTEEEAKQFMLNFQLQQDHVFVQGDPHISAKVLQGTKDIGVDVVLNFASEIPLPGIGAVTADCGRIVHVGKTNNIIDSISLEATIFRKGITITTFDTGSLINLQTPAGQRLRRKLLDDSVALYRKETNHPAIESPRIFELANIGDAFRAVKTRGGPVVVSLENEEALVPSLPLKYDSTFSPNKSYLLVGCLGGLGRSMSKWMLARGARKFVFVGRSGTDREPARRLVEDLELSGAQVTVVRGDVVNYSDIERAVASIDGPIGGVIQAAMGLDEALFTSMPRDYWNSGLRPKIQGSWNLHNAIRGRDQELDFFLMTSSVSGSVGTATESNYCAANYFLDVFARHRRALGLPATSVGLGMISEVGYLHENPEIEALLLRKGIQAINEDEMLQIIDAALSVPTDIPGSYDELARGHVLTGLEPLGLKELRAKGFEGTSPVLGDPRASLLSSALDETDGSSRPSTTGLPSEVAEAIESGGSVEDAVLKMIAKKFSSLVLIPEDKLSVTMPLSKVGVDSMLAAEFRSWIFQAFKFDVPYLTLLSATATLVLISELVSQKLVESIEM